MIESEMVYRMARRGLLLAPFVIAALWLAGSGVVALSGALGLLLAVGNLWVTGRVLGGVAENNPQMLMAVGMSTFIATLVVLTGIAVVLRDVAFVSFTAMGLTLVCSHMVLVVWEAVSGLGSGPSDSSNGAGAREVGS